MKAVILARPDRVGDVVVTSACIPALRELHPGSPIILVARPIMQSVFSGEGSVAGFIPYHGPQDQNELKRKLNELNAAFIYHFHPDEGVQVAAEEAGIPERIGFIDGNTSVGLTTAFPNSKSDGLMHEAAYCRKLLCEASGNSSLPEIQQACLAPDPSALKTLNEKAPWLNEDEVRIAINPTAARIILRWPAVHFERLIAALAQLGRRIVLIGHPSGDPALVCLRKQCNGFASGLSDLSGQLDLAESAWLLKYCGLHISRDTGTSHLAAAMGCPTLTIFGRLEPEYGPKRWGPLGDQAHLVCAEVTKRWWETKRQFWKRSFRSVTPERVIHKVEDILG